MQPGRFPVTRLAGSLRQRVPAKMTEIEEAELCSECREIAVRGPALAGGVSIHSGPVFP